MPSAASSNPPATHPTTIPAGYSLLDLKWPSVLATMLDQSSPGWQSWCMQHQELDCTRLDLHATRVLDPCNIQCWPITSVHSGQPVMLPAAPAHGQRLGSGGGGVTLVQEPTAEAGRFPHHQFQRFLTLTSEGSHQKGSDPHRGSHQKPTTSGRVVHAHECHLLGTIMRL